MNVQTIFQQENIEKNYGKQFIHELVKKDLLSTPELVSDLEFVSKELREEYLAKEYSYASKNDRITDWIELHDNFIDYLDETILDITAVVIRNDGDTIQSIVGQCIGFIGLDHINSAKIIGELLAYMSRTDLVTIMKPEIVKQCTKVWCGYALSDDVTWQLKQKMYDPPMLVKPHTVKCNRDQLQITGKPESMILGHSTNFHKGDICLDHINRMNAIELSLDIGILDDIRELPSKPFKTEMQEKNWEKFMKQSDEVYRLVVRHGNKFHMKHKYDKRGRTYCSGYHINYQGADFKKAIVQLANKELVEGVPC